MTNAVQMKLILKVKVNKSLTLHERVQSHKEGKRKENIKREKLLC